MCSARSMISCALAALLVVIAVPSASARRYLLPYDQVELYTTDIYSPGNPAVFLDEAVINKRGNAVVSYYTDSACTQSADSIQTLTQDTKFWAKATIGAWSSQTRSFWVYVSGTQLDLAAECDRYGAVAVSATVGRGGRGRLPTGEVAFYLDSIYLGSANLGSSGRAAFVFPAPGIGEYNLLCRYYGDDSFAPADNEITITCTADGVAIVDKAAAQAGDVFSELYKNAFISVSIPHSTQRLVTTHYILTLDFASLDMDDIYFYLYDAGNNTFTPVTAYLDSAERVNLITSSPGVLIVSSGQLESR